MPNYFDSLARHIASGLAKTKSFGDDTGWRTVGGRHSVRYPGSDMDWASEAGTLWHNAVGMICAGYIFDKMVEPRIHVVYQGADGLLEPVVRHPAAELVLNPNTEYRGNALLQAMALSYKFDGNAYAVKVRGSGGSGVPVELYYVPHWLISPMTPPDGGPTQFYQYKQPQVSGGYKMVAIPRANVIHLKDGIDPENPRKGLCRLKAVLRSFVAEGEIDSTIAIVLRNRGNIGTILSPASWEPGFEIDDDQLEEFKRKVQAQSTGDARGGIIAADFPLKIDRTSQSPQDLMLDTIGERSLVRVCGALSIDPAALGLATAGKGKGGQYGEKQKQARIMSYETCILPLLANIAEGLTYELLPDFPVTTFARRKSMWFTKWAIKPLRSRAYAEETDGDSEYRFNFDYSDVNELADDEDALSKRAVDEFAKNIATLDEAREMTGKPPCDDPEKGEKFWFELAPPPGGTDAQDGNGNTPDDDEDDDW